MDESARDETKRVARRVGREVGKRVRKWRTSHRWSQEDLGERMGIDAREVRRIEAGDNLSILMLVRISRAFDKSVAELFSVRSPRRHAK